MVPIPEAVRLIPGRDSNATHELVFKASDLPPLGFKSYYVEKITIPSSPLKAVLGEAKYTIGKGVNKLKQFYLYVREMK